MYLAHDTKEAQFVLNYIASRARASLKAVLQQEEFTIPHYLVWRKKSKREIRSAACVHGLCGFNGWEVTLDPILKKLSVAFLKPLASDAALARSELELILSTPAINHRSHPVDVYVHAWWDYLYNIKYIPVPWERALGFHFHYYANFLNNPVDEDGNDNIRNDGD